MRFDPQVTQCCRIEIGRVRVDRRRANDLRFQHSRCRKLLFLYCGLYFAIDLAAQQQHQAAEIKPGQQNDDGAQRTIGGRVVVEVVNVHAKAERGHEPAQHAKSADQA